MAAKLSWRLAQRLTENGIEATDRAGLLERRGLAVQRLPEDLRLLRRGNLNFAFNYGDTAIEVPAPAAAQFLVGKRQLGRHDLAVWC